MFLSNRRLFRSVPPLESAFSRFLSLSLSIFPSVSPSRSPFFRPFPFFPPSRARRVFVRALIRTDSLDFSPLSFANHPLVPRFVDTSPCRLRACHMIAPTLASRQRAARTKFRGFVWKPRRLKEHRASFQYHEIESGVSRYLCQQTTPLDRSFSKVFLS